MAAVKTAHSGVASGINNAVSRVAGLLAIAIFGVFLARAFDADMHARLDRLSLAPGTRAQIEEQLPKMAGAELKSVTLESSQLVAVQQAINETFSSGFRMVVLGSAILALAAAGFGAAIQDKRVATKS
jgi:hypothetical protein